jgi:hypothetical protein
MSVLGCLAHIIFLVAPEPFIGEFADRDLRKMPCPTKRGGANFSPFEYIVGIIGHAVPQVIDGRELASTPHGTQHLEVKYRDTLAFRCIICIANVPS